MNKQGFLNLLKDPNNISETDLLGLEEIIANFPFCQTAHILAAKGASDNGKMLADKQIRKAAAYTSERKNLKRILSPNTFQNPLTSTQEPFKTTEQETTTQTAIESPAIIAEDIIKADTLPEKNMPIVQNVSEESEEKTDLSSTSFFEELEKNLKELHALKEKAANTAIQQDIAIQNEIVAKENSEINTQNIQPTAALVEPQLIEAPVKAIEDEKDSILIPEPIKQHISNETIFSSRLDEIIEGKERPSQEADISSEADILLNYLTYLDKNKTYPKKDKKKTGSIIDKFIEKDPSISKMDIKSLPEEVEDKASESYSLKGGLISENMANIYVLQGKKSKAIEIYEQLILKNPEKRAYFASKIEKLK